MAWGEGQLGVFAVAGGGRGRAGVGDDDPLELVRRTYASFATAWLVKKDFSLIQQAR